MGDFDILDDLESQMDAAIQGLLSRRGWKHTSSTPDCVWMWEKEYNGKVYSVSQQRALQMEQNGVWA